MSVFLATYSLGVIVVFFIGPPLQKLSSFSAGADFPSILFLLAGTYFFLPTGVALPFIAYGSIPYSIQLLLVGLSYILTPLLPLFGSSTEKPRTFRRLYFLFIALVIMNVAGCISSPVPNY